MFDAGALLTLYAETPVHPGAPGTRGAIDLRVQRDAVTQVPCIWGSSLRGVLRDAVEAKGLDVSALFGADVGASEGRSGAVAVLDAQLLLFPVREAGLVWVWVTAPMVIARLSRMLESCGFAEVAGTRPDGSAFDYRVSEFMSLASELGTVTNQGWVASVPPGSDSKMVIGDSRFTLSTNSPLECFCDFVRDCLMPRDESYAYLRNRLNSRIVVVSDDQFVELTQTEVEIQTRIRLNDRKTTTGDEGNMWTEEVLPAECLFYTTLLAGPPAEVQAQVGEPAGRAPSLSTGARVLTELSKVGPVLQVGGDESVGRGFVRARFVTHEVDGQGVGLRGDR